MITGHARRVTRRGRRSVSLTSGQATAEALLVVMLLIALCVAANLLGATSARALDATSASRYLAFAHARGQVSASPGRSRGLGSHRVDRVAWTTPFYQVGGGAANSAALRRQWHAEELGKVVGRVGRMSVSMLQGAGQVGSRQASQARVAESSFGWSAAKHASVREGQRIALRAARVDDGWARSAPRFDWLSPWADLEVHHRSVGGPSILSYDKPGRAARNGED